MQVYITTDLSIVKVSGSYPEDISKAYGILTQFKQTRLGSTWGLDGVAEYVASQHGTFTINKSGISKRQAQQWLKEGKAQPTN